MNTKPNIQDIQDIKEGENCTQGQVYKVNCNTCRCGPSNRLICTKKACLSDDEKVKLELLKKKKYQFPKTKSDLPELPATKCVPGKLYAKGCQRCFCNDKKIGLCTNKACIDIAGMNFSDLHMSCTVVCIYVSPGTYNTINTMLIILIQLKNKCEVVI